MMEPPCLLDDRSQAPLGQIPSYTLHTSRAMSPSCSGNSWPAESLRSYGIRKTKATNFLSSIVHYPGVELPGGRHLFVQLLAEGMGGGSNGRDASHWVIYLLIPVEWGKATRLKHLWPTKHCLTAGSPCLYQEKCIILKSHHGSRSHPCVLFE